MVVRCSFVELTNRFRRMADDKKANEQIAINNEQLITNNK